MLSHANNPIRSLARSFAGALRDGDADERRARRTRFLLAVVVVLSVVDLVLTVGFMKTTGMAEANPLVRALLGVSNSAVALAVFKTLTVVTPVLIVHRFRRFRPGELAAWVSVAGLCVVVIQWVRYATFVGELDLGVLTQMAAVDADWVLIP